MMILKGKYAEAKVFTDDIEEAAMSQIINLLNQAFMQDADPRFMPDVHAGKGCTVGTTMKIRDKVCPNLVGVDIACGMLVVKLPVKDLDLAAFDQAVHEKIPAGKMVHEKENIDFADFDRLRCADALKSLRSYIMRSIGTLGGGNHFVEIDRGEDGTLYMVIHSGSRYLGKSACEHYMQIAEQKMKGGKDEEQKARTELIRKLKEEKREREIPAELEKLKAEYRVILSAQNKDLAVIEGQDMEDYIHDCGIINRYAMLNRETMARNVLGVFGWNLDSLEHFHTIHNYIDTEHRILRKGAISAQKGEKLIIPLNMKDGCILGIGKGNPDWNCSGPHGAGRRMSRAQAKKELTVEDFRSEMNGIYSTTVNASTLDEAPGAYKDAIGILINVEDSVDVLEVIKPIYSFKASE